MRRIETILAAIVLGTVLLPTTALAVDLAGYRATYALSLGKGDDSGSVVEIRGETTSTFEKTCAGWLFDQSWLMNVMRNDGRDSPQHTFLSSWESLDGKSYRFSGRNIFGSLSEDIQGHAAHGADGAQAVFSQPETRTIALDPNVLFPTMHSIRLLAHAQAGEHIFSSTVFDGSQVDEGRRIEAFISKPFPAGKGAGSTLNALLDRPGWNVRMGLYPPGSMAAEPEYSIEVQILDNGIPSRMVLEYPTFSINVKLIKIKPIISPRC